MSTMIREIPAPETYPLRHLVLRRGQSFSAVQWPGDEVEGAFHVGYFEADRLISIVSFIPEEAPEFDEPRAVRLRGMATHPEFRYKGAAREIVLYGLERLRQQQVLLVWCHARTPVVPFYFNLGFAMKGEEFEVPEIGPHVLMYRWL